MGFISWIVFGMIAGFIASKIVNKRGEGFLLDTILGIVGAIVGGICMSLIGGRGVTGFNLHSLIVAVVGAIIVVLLYRKVIAKT